MNELEDFMAGQTPPPPPSSSASSNVQSPAMKNVKDVLGERLRTQMQGEKRKLEDNACSDILSKTQKMDNDCHDSESTMPTQSRLLAQALMDKQPRNGAMAAAAIKSPSPKEQRNEELTALLNDYPNMVASRQVGGHHHPGPLPQGGPKMQRMPAGNRGMMNTSDMMPMDNFYGMQQQQPRLPMQHHPQQQRPPINNWNSGGGPGGMDPRMYNVPPPQQKMRNFEGGPPPNAWVGPAGPNKVMMSAPPPGQGSPYYNGCQRTPMMRPSNGMNNYNDYNNGSPQMYGNVRNYGMNSPGNAAADPYGQPPHRFGSPNAGGRVCPQPGYSPNNHPAVVDNMHAVRSSANFHADSNAGYNNGYNGGQQNEYLQQQGYNQRQQVRPNAGFMPNAGGGNMQQVYNNNRIAMPQSSPAMNSHNQGNGMEIMQQQQGFHHQQQHHFMDQQFNNNESNFSEFNMQSMENDWRHQALSIRQSLLNKLKEALTSQNFPNAQSMAESYEKEAFMSAESLKDYQYKLVQWLASIYDSSSHPSLSMMNENKADSPMTSTTADSSTNGLNDVTTSCSPNDQSTGDNDQKPLLPADDLMLATPKSEGCLSPSSPSLTSSVNSPLSCSNVMTTASSVATTTTTPSASPSTSNGGGTFQAPATVVMPSASDIDSKTSSSSLTLTTSSLVTSTTSKVVTTAVGSTQRRVSGGGGTNQSVVVPPVVAVNGSTGGSTTMSSIGNNPQSVDSGIGLGSPRSITSASSTTLYSPKIQGTSPSLLPGSDNSPEKANSSS